MRIKSLIVLLFFFVQNSIGQNTGSELLNTARESCDSLDCPEKYIFAYYLMGENPEYSLKERLEYLSIAENLSLEHGGLFRIMSIKAHQGMLYSQKGQYLESLRNFREGMQYLGHAQTQGERSQEGWFLTGYGIVLYEVALYEDAIQIFEDCAKVMLSNEDEYGAAVAYNNIALSHLKLDRPKKALESFTKAFELRLNFKKHFPIAHSLLYLSRTYRILDKHSMADSCLQQAEYHAAMAKNLEFFGQIYTEWADLSLDKGEFEKAAKYLQKASKMERPFQERDWLNLKIRLFEETKQNDSLIRYLDSSIAYSRKTGNKDWLYHYLLKKEKALRKKGSDSKADLLLREINLLGSKIISLKDSLQSDLFQAQREFIDNREKLSLLEQKSKSQEEVIKSQNRTIALITIFTIISLIGFIIFYRLNNNLRRANHLVTILSKRTIAAANAMDNAVFALDEHLNLVFTNKTALRYMQDYLGFKASLDKPFLPQFNKTEIATAWENHFKNALEKGNFQNISQHEIGGENFYHVISLALIESDGNPQGFVVVITDITENQRKSQELVKKSNALSKANEAKEKMLSLLAHDLKEGVIGSLELAKLSLEDDQDIKTHMRLISESLGKTRTLLLKTLDWVKQQSDGLRLSKQAFYADRLMNDILQ